MSNHKHLTLQDRKKISYSIEKSISIRQISESLHKDSTTIRKELKLHRIKYNNEQNGHCSKRDKHSYVCNGCQKLQICIYDKYIYNPEIAHQEYIKKLILTRSNIKFKKDEIKKIAKIIVPLLKNGLSPYHIITGHPELNISVKTLYNYINKSIFNKYGICNINLKRKTKWKTKNLRKIYKRKNDYKYLIGRKFTDYTNYIAKKPYIHIVEMDTVYNDPNNGPYIQTFLFKKSYLFFGILHLKNNIESTLRGINILNEILGNQLFKKYVSVILTDRGGEFSQPSIFENYNNTKRTKIFYCDPMKPNQKGTIEQKHTMLRNILPKRKNLFKLGLKEQTDLNKVISTINSIPLQVLNGKTSLEYTEFLYPDLYKKMIDFGLEKIPINQVVLNPSLLIS